MVNLNQPLLSEVHASPEDLQPSPAGKVMPIVFQTIHGCWLWAPVSCYLRVLLSTGVVSSFTPVIVISFSIELELWRFVIHSLDWKMSSVCEHAIFVFNKTSKELQTFEIPSPLLPIDGVSSCRSDQSHSFCVVKGISLSKCYVLQMRHLKSWPTYETCLKAATRCFVLILCCATILQIETFWGKAG